MTDRDDGTAGLAERTMVITREIAAPLALVWRAWTDPDALAQWWGPAGYSCRTKRIDLRTGGEWLFDMIGPDGTVYPNHHAALVHEPMQRISYRLLAGENGPEHAAATAAFEDFGGRTRVTLSMVFVTQAEHDGAKSFGADKLGLETLGKLAAHLGVA